MAPTKPQPKRVLKAGATTTSGPPMAPTKPKRISKAGATPTATATSGPVAALSPTQPVPRPVSASESGSGEGSDDCDSFSTAQGHGGASGNSRARDQFSFERRKPAVPREPESESEYESESDKDGELQPPKPLPEARTSTPSAKTAAPSECEDESESESDKDGELPPPKPLPEARTSTPSAKAAAPSESEDESESESESNKDGDLPPPSPLPEARTSAPSAKTAKTTASLAAASEASTDTGAKKRKSPPFVVPQSKAKDDINNKKREDAAAALVAASEASTDTGGKKRKPPPSVPSKPKGKDDISNKKREKAAAFAAASEASTDTGGKKRKPPPSAPPQSNGKADISEKKQAVAASLAAAPTTVTNSKSDSIAQKGNGGATADGGVADGAKQKQKAGKKRKVNSDANDTLPLAVSTDKKQKLSAAAATVSVATNKGENTTPWKKQFERLFSLEEELDLLRALVAFRNEDGGHGDKALTTSEIDLVYNTMDESFRDHFTRAQVGRKVGTLKRKHTKINMENLDKKKKRKANRPLELEALELSIELWGIDAKGKKKVDGQANGGELHQGEINNSTLKRPKAELLESKAVAASSSVSVPSPAIDFIASVFKLNDREFIRETCSRMLPGDCKALNLIWEGLKNKETDMALHRLHAHTEMITLVFKSGQS